MQTSDFNYNLPEELIAQTPLKDRTSSRLMVLDKKTGEVEHKHFRNIINYLNPGDTLVLNNTRVIPARVFGNREGHTGKIEMLLLKQREQDIWECLIGRAKKVVKDTVLVFGEGKLKAKVLDVLEDGIRLVKLEYTGILNEILYDIGTMPLPPYITESLKEQERYQTVYSKVQGSAAAPTAGLHFTQELLDEIKEKGVNIAYVTLHVGLGTFRPVKVDDVENHVMHSEYYEITEDVCKIINQTKKSGNKVVCVGTTSCRVLESASDEQGVLHEKFEDTSIFIYPGYKFKVVDNLITNFHLPESTLIMLVSALAGKDNVLKAYEEAVEEKYRFFSFGDAMYIK
ncbi:MAG: tRNA preQ1(34) S-adenosylmethionine ribosyltransferase-isomerase QueA [Clostridia bacterium]|nr:tRNA preQ1(34) S-adenosylmethionine ribosyltransferase-isomerase QueA [Clostridia bacterium]